MVCTSQKYLTNFEQSGSLHEISWTSEVLTLARIYDRGKATPLASDPIPDLSSTQSTIICQWQVQVDDSARGKIPRLSSPHRNRLMNACHVVSERCQTWCQIVNGHWNHFGHIQGQFTHPTPYKVSQNFWQKPCSPPVEYEFYRV